MKIMNRKEGKKIAVMAAVIVGFMLFAFLPLASAGVTDFTVTPGTGLAGTVDSYNALVTTDGVTTINITIPAGFIAVTPMSGGVEIVRVDFWNGSTRDHYGYATITANDTNPTTQVDIYWELGGDAITSTQSVDYAASATNTFESPFGDGSLAIIKLPTVTQNGSINITISSTTFLLEDVYIAFKQFVRNPSVADVYNFYADGEVAPVTIHRQPLGDIAYLKKGTYGDTDYDLYIYTAPTTLLEPGALIASDYWSPDGSTVGITAIDINGDGIDEIAYLKRGPSGDLDFNLFIHTAPTTLLEPGALIASDYWSPDGSTVGITAIDINGDGIDEIAYLKRGPSGDLDFNLFIHTAPTTLLEPGALIASDYWSPDGSTVGITAIDIDKIAYLKRGPSGDLDFNLFIHTAPTTLLEPGALIASDYWSPDGSTVGITAIDIDKIAYLKRGPSGDLDFNLFIHTAPTTLLEPGTLIASDYWSPDGQTEDTSALW